MSNMLGSFEKHPDVARASHVGEPTMVDPEPETATKVVQQIATSAAGGAGGDNKVSVETTGATGAPNHEAPRSDTPAAAAETPAARAPAQAGALSALKPSVADPNELKPNVEADDPSALPPLQQSNQLENSGGTSSGVASRAPAKAEEMADISSSKKKKKKGVRKLNPF